MGNADNAQNLRRLTAALGSSSAPDGNYNELAEACLRFLREGGFDQDPVTVAADRLVASEWQGLPKLITAWRGVKAGQLQSDARSLAELGERVLKAGEPLIAFDILKSGLSDFPGHTRLRQLQALALARSGATLRAMTELEKLVSEGQHDEETLGLLARTKKDLWEDGGCSDTRLLEDANDFYGRGFERAVLLESPNGAIYTGVNEATTALLLGDVEAAQLRAEHVSQICAGKPDSDYDYWAQATWGECALIASDLEAAQTHYQRAVELADGNIADIASTRRNARLLIECLRFDLRLLDEWFPIPTICVFSGHLIDRPGASERFPHRRIPEVRRQLAKIISEEKVGFSYSAAACGADLVFAKAVRESGADCCIVLPLPPDPFATASVTIDQEYDWMPEFQEALDQSSRVTVVNDLSRSAQPIHFDYANRVMTGLAGLHARSLGTKIVPVAVWDERPAGGMGGTASVVAMWRELGWNPRVVNPLSEQPIRVSSDSSPGQPLKLKSAWKKQFIADIRALLFADVVGYSKLAEEEIPAFVREFMGAIKACLDTVDVKVEAKNTWGDAIYMVFENVRDAGITALKITEHVKAIDWKTKGFRTQLNLRTGLHAGPVYGFHDPITDAWNRSGAHVSRAARIEPIAPSGEVYASEAFAALANVQEVRDFTCEYVGVTPMAKGYGDFPTYHVLRNSNG